MNVISGSAVTITESGGQGETPPDWGEHTISLRVGDMTELEPGNVVHAILGMWMEGWGVEVSETILVTPSGCETLTDFPREIFVK